MKNSFDLDRILDLRRWQKLQDQLSLITKMAIVTVDYKGNPITEHSMCCPFCKSVRSNPQLSKYCQICDSRGGLEAVRSQKPYIYFCHFNIIDIAIPITVEDKYLGAIMAGQIRLSDTSALSSFEHLLPTQKNSAGEKHLKAHMTEYEAIPLLDYTQVLQNTQMLYELSTYIVESAVSKFELLDAYETFYQRTQRVAQLSRPPASPDLVTKSTYLTLKQPDEELSSVSVLKPALQYIEENRGQFVTQAQMAELCHLSPSYFSRLFTQEQGINFSQYLAAKKISWAKELVCSTEDTVEAISEKLGFSSSAYFIKVFKKQEGITPYMYRKFNLQLNH